tara:strand:- start:20589 stop:21389 length:801 start_codon:yes stop_codon:yes gene_type:complete
MKPESLLENALLGFIQGVSEWLPISSEGLVALVGNLAWGRDFEDAIALALLLHIGTALSAIVYFRREIKTLILDTYKRPRESNPLLAFIIYSSIGSALSGIPILIGINSISALDGSVVMIIVGSLVWINGAVQTKQKTALELRKIDSINWVEATGAGLIQGLAILPGLSRSGLTISFLLFRKYESKYALFLSFLMSIPASLGAALLIIITRDFSLQIEEIIGAVVAFFIGLITIHLLISLASRIRFSSFLFTAGLVLIIGGIMGLI